MLRWVPEQEITWHHAGQQWAPQSTPPDEHDQIEGLEETDGCMYQGKTRIICTAEYKCVCTYCVKNVYVRMYVYVGV